MTDLRHADAPGCETEGEATFKAGGPIPSLLPTPDAALGDPREFFRTSFAVLVSGKSVRRHLYFNLPAAERCVRRAEARGDRAEMILVRLVPVDARHLEAGGPHVR